MEQNLHSQYTLSLLLVAGETENAVFFTKPNIFCPSNNNATESQPTVQLAVPLQ